MVHKTMYGRRKTARTVPIAQALVPFCWLGLAFIGTYMISNITEVKKNLFLFDFYSSWLTATDKRISEYYLQCYAVIPKNIVHRRKNTKKYFPKQFISFTVISLCVLYGLTIRPWAPFLLSFYLFFGAHHWLSSLNHEYYWLCLWKCREEM